MSDGRSNKRFYQPRQVRKALGFDLQTLLTTLVLRRACDSRLEKKTKTRHECFGLWPPGKNVAALALWKCRCCAPWPACSVPRTSPEVAAATPAAAAAAADAMATATQNDDDSGRPASLSKCGIEGRRDEGNENAVGNGKEDFCVPTIVGGWRTAPVCCSKNAGLRIVAGRKEEMSCFHACFDCCHRRPTPPVHSFPISREAATLTAVAAPVGCVALVAAVAAAAAARHTYLEYVERLLLTHHFSGGLPLYYTSLGDFVSELKATNQRTCGQGVLLCFRRTLALPVVSNDLCRGNKQLVLSPWVMDIAEQLQESFAASPRRHQNLYTAPLQSAKNHVNKLLVTLSSPHRVRKGCSPTLQSESNNRPFLLPSLPATDHFVFVLKWRTARGTHQRLFNPKGGNRKD